MPSIRRLKKDIDSFVFEVISDCFTFGKLHPDEKDEEVTGIISDAVSLRNDLISRVNKPVQSDDPKVKRSYYNSINKDLFVGVDNLFGRLSTISGKK
jgi:hypothetical protein